MNIPMYLKRYILENLYNLSAFKLFKVNTDIYKCIGTIQYV